jgi:hypothetical protein
LNRYCKNFNTVYQIWDSNKIDKPSYKFLNQKGLFEKKYGTKFSKNLVYTTDELNKRYPNAKEGDIFKLDETDTYIVRIKNNHKWFYVNKGLVDLFKNLKGKNVILVGGAYGECITDVYESMETFGVLVKYNKNYIYSAKNSNKEYHKIKTQL